MDFGGHRSARGSRQHLVSPEVCSNRVLFEEPEKRQRVPPALARMLKIILRYFSTFFWGLLFFPS